MSKTDSVNKIVDDLLEFARKYGEQNSDEPDVGECWDAIDKARLYLQATGSEAPSLPAGGADTSKEASATRKDHVIAMIKADGLSLADCVKALAVPNDDPYVIKARDLVGARNDDFSIDDVTTTSKGDDGAWVLSWIWVSNEEAGIIPYPELWESVARCARKALTDYSGLGIDARQFRTNQVDWLDDLITNFSDELDAIASAETKNPPGDITWINADNTEVRFRPSEALSQLLLLALMATNECSLSAQHIDQAAHFCVQYGAKLDALLSVIHTT